MANLVPLSPQQPAVPLAVSPLSNINFGPPPAPTLTPSAAGGTLATGTYYVRVTYVFSANKLNESLPSPEVSVNVTGPTGSISIGAYFSPTGNNTATMLNGIAAYISTKPGQELGFNGVAGFGNALVITNTNGTRPLPTVNQATFPAWAGSPQNDGSNDNYNNSFGPGIGRKPVLPPVQQVAFTYIQNQSAG